MKTSLALCLAALLFSLPARAGEDVEFPKDEPLISFTIPDGWKTHEEGGVFQAAASQDLDTMLVIRPLKATKKQGSQVIAEIKETLDKTYGDAIEYDKLEEGGTSNLGFYVLNAEAKTHSANEGDVTSHINSLMITFPDSDELLLAQFLSTQAGSDANGEDIASIIHSLKKAE